VDPQLPLPAVGEAAKFRPPAAIPDRDVFQGLSPDEVRSRVYGRLVASESLRWQRASYAREVARGLSRLLAFDMPGGARYLPDDEVERFGGVTALWEAGLASLRAMPAEEQQRFDFPDGGSFVTLSGDSVHTASRVLVMEDLLRQTGQPVDPRFGVVVAMPHWTAVVVHPIIDGSALLSMGHVARFARRFFANHRGPISPHAYWWRNGTWAQLSQPGPGRHATMFVPGELNEVLEQLRQADVRASRRRWRRR
jgi:hypothetical protein